MSEFQLYEFLALDRSLSSEDLANVRALSKRVQLTSSHAMFTYSYGNFPAEPLDVLAKYYDVMFYLANWGSKQLAFRFPKNALDQEALKPYYYGIDEIELTTAGQYTILNIAFHEEEGLGWIQEEEHLAAFAPLRNDILSGDLRVLYLAWIASAQRGGFINEDDPEAENDLVEPPVPPGLGELTAPLRAFMAFFEIDQDIVGAAAAASPALKVSQEPLERWVELLPEAERNSFLVRAAQGEPIGAELLQRLRKLGGGTGRSASEAPRRRYSELVAASQEVKHKRQEHERKAAERAHAAKMEAFAPQAEQVWAKVPQEIARRTASGYDQATAYLVQLRELAVYRGERAAFDARLNDLIMSHDTSVALLRRFREKKLIE